MERPTVALGIGIVVGGVVIGVGILNTQRLQRKVDTLRATCLLEGQREAKSPAKPLRPGELDFSVIPPECDPAILAQGTFDSRQASTDATLTSVQRAQVELVRAQRELRRSHDLPVPIASAVVAIFAIPWLWYFFLRRVRELRDAVVGK